MTTDTVGGAETVGGRLRRLRLERGLSQRDLSAPGVSYAYISRIEAGARRPSVKALRRLAQKLAVTPEYLETGAVMRDSEARELRLAEAEIRLRLDGDVVAEELLEILEEAELHADETAAVRARIALGLQAASLGDHAAAIRYLERALASDLVTPASRPDAYATLGHAHAASGDPRRAADLFERTLDELEQLAPEDAGSRVRFSIYLSYALTDLGDLQRAKRVVEEALRSADEAADPYTRVRLHWSLGRISYEQAKPHAALEHFRKAIGLLEATEDTIHLARANLSYAAAVLASGGDAGEAGKRIAHAERLLGPNADAADLAVVRWLQALHAQRGGSFGEAERFAREAQGYAAALPNQHALATAALAEAMAGRGDPGADAAFREAVRELDAHGTPRERNDVLRAYARYLRASGRGEEAMDVLERAAEVAATYQASSPAVNLER